MNSLPQPCAPIGSAETDRPWTTNEQANPTPVIKGYHCHQCKDVGWYYADTKPGQADFGRALRCACKVNDDRIGRQRKLRSVDGLTAIERRMQFGDFQITEHNRAAYAATTEALALEHGFVTLTGAPGRGKSFLLVCAINLARDNGIPAVYSLTENLMEYLKAAYSPKTEATFVERWELLVNAQVLALDEIDKYNSTEWAQVKFFHLLNERFRQCDKKITILASNAPLTTLPDAVSSRLSASRAKIVQIGGPDNRVQ